jgi:hypothetical protein
MKMVLFNSFKQLYLEEKICAKTLGKSMIILISCSTFRKRKTV